jgi:hypothetical protein
MRLLLAVLFVLFASPALAQFPPPGIYTCVDGTGTRLGMLSLLAAGDYQWDTPEGKSAAGQMSSASTSVTALSGPLADQHWSGQFVTGDKTTFSFKTDGGAVTCQ